MLGFKSWRVNPIWCVGLLQHTVVVSAMAEFFQRVFFALKQLNTVS